MQGPEAVKKAVLGTWAQFMDCPEVATKCINFIAVDWPAQPWTGGSYTGEKEQRAWGTVGLGMGEAAAGEGAARPSCPSCPPSALPRLLLRRSLHDARRMDLPQGRLLQALRPHPLVRLPQRAVPRACLRGCGCCESTHPSCCVHPLP